MVKMTFGCNCGMDALNPIKGNLHVYFSLVYLYHLFFMRIRSVKKSCFHLLFDTSNCLQYRVNWFVAMTIALCSKKTNIFCQYSNSVGIDINSIDCYSIFSCHTQPL